MVQPGSAVHADYLQVPVLGREDLAMETGAELSDLVKDFGPSTASAADAADAQKNVGFYEQ